LKSRLPGAPLPNPGRPDPVRRRLDIVLTPRAPVNAQTTARPTRNGPRLDTPKRDRLC
jgi:hypothetical protein